MDFLAFIGFIVLAVAVVIGVNLYRKPEQTRQRLARLVDRWRG